MNRRFAWILLVVAGISFGCLLGGYRDSAAQPPVRAAADQREDEIVEQLKQVNAQLKELNTMFRTGKARVIEVINPVEQ